MELVKTSLVRDKVVNAMFEHKGIIIFDTETTGLHPEKGDRVIQLSAQKYVFSDGELVLDKTMSTFFKPPVPIEPHIEQLTGITNERLMGERTFAEQMDEIRAFFGTDSLICGHNVKFDIRFMKSEYAIEGETFQYADFLDTLVMARDRINKDEILNYKLFTIVDALKLNDDSGLTAHSAIDDVEATARIFNVFLKEYMDEWSADTSAMSEKEKPAIYAIKFWKGYRGESRIYLDISNGRSIFYDIRRFGWGSKNVDLDTIDMQFVESRAMEMTGSYTMEEFAHFRSRVTA